MIRTDTWSKDAGRRVLEAVREADLPLEPTSLEIYEEVDGFDDRAWRIRLALPAPSGDTWPSDHLYALRRTAVTALDAIAEEDDRVQPGATVALLVPDADVGVEDEEAAPQEGEGVAVDDEADGSSSEALG